MPVFGGRFSPCLFVDRGFFMPRKRGKAIVVDPYVNKGGKRLRRGYTTGSCAALAASAATRMLLTGEDVHTANITTPGGVALSVAVESAVRLPNGVRCAVRKDAGDDVDATDGLLIFADVTYGDAPGITVDGGEGVGRVTRLGLDQPVGAAAINRVPRRMIADAVAAVCAELGHTGGLGVVISAPGGERVAERTFNPQLGIEGGISILGTSGIVEPMSVQALVDTIEAEMKMHRAEGAVRLVLTPGNYGETFLRSGLSLGHLPHAKCSNYIGEAIDLAVSLGFEELLLVGHIGKLVKVAGGIMNTHSLVADARGEILAAHAALCGCGPNIAAAVMNSATTDAALDILESVELLEPVINSLLIKIQQHIDRRSKGAIAAGAILFSNIRGLLGKTAGADLLLSKWEAISD